MNQDNGGIIGKINTPTTLVASGVWTLQDQFEAQTSSIWPLAFPQTTIVNSLRFDYASSDRLTKTFSGNGTSNKIMTFSFWCKKTIQSGWSYIIHNGQSDGDPVCVIGFEDNFLKFNYYVGGSTLGRLKTNRLFRDSSAWYHIVVAIDTTQSTSSNRIKFYVNGEQETSFSQSDYPSENQTITLLQGTDVHTIGASAVPDGYFGGYIAEFVVVDGQQLLPTSFGVFNTVSNIWEPRGYAGTYGTNGFRLDFADSSALGNDVSGNDNDFTANNLTSIDQATDTCSNNFATLNPLIRTASTPAFSDGNCTVSPSAGAFQNYFSTIGMTGSGKYYWEYKVNGTPNSANYHGVSSDVELNNLINTSNVVGYTSAGYSIVASSGNKYNNTNSTSYGSAFSDGDIIMGALDLDNGKIWYGKNGTWFNSGNPASGSNEAFSSISASNTYFVSGTMYNGGFTSLNHNFGNAPFAISSGNADANGHGNFEYAVPSGYFSLCTKNLAEFG